MPSETAPWRLTIRSRLAFTASCIPLLVTVSACSSGSSSGPADRAAGGPTPSALAAPSPTAPGLDAATSTPPFGGLPPTPSVDAGTRTQAAAPPCSSRQLTLTVGLSQGAAGTQYQPLRLLNHGPLCTLAGYPGVSLLAADGSQIGSPAEKAAGRSVTVQLGPQAVAHAVLSIANAGSFPASTCRPRQAESVRVYPPGQTEALVATDATTACSADGTGQLHITAVSPGDS
jgi:hypothetical protein